MDEILAPREQQIRIPAAAAFLAAAVAGVHAVTPV